MMNSKHAMPSLSPTRILKVCAVSGPYTFGWFRQVSAQSLVVLEQIFKGKVRPGNHKVRFV